MSPLQGQADEPKPDRSAHSGKDREFRDGPTPPPRELVRLMKPNACPTCRKVGPWLEGPSGPFCSKRCRLIDLGKWLGEENCISGPLRPEHLDAYADLPSDRDLDRPEES